MKNKQCIWIGEEVKPIELDETGRWVTVQIIKTGSFHLARVGELQGFDPSSIPQVTA